MLRIGGQKVPANTLLLVVSDLVWIGLGIIIATCLRIFHLNAIQNHLQQKYAFFRIALAMLVCELSLYYNDLYNPEAVRRQTELLTRLLQSLGTACFAMAILYYAAPEFGLGRGIAVLATVVIFLLLLG